MKQNIKLLLILIFSSLIFTSCSENELNESPQTLQNHIQTKSSYIITENPFNYVGEEHNNILLEVGKNMQNKFDEIIKKSVLNSNDMESIMQYATEKSSNVIAQRYNITTDSAINIANYAINGFSTIDFTNNPTDLDVTIQNLIETSNGDINVLITNVFNLEKVLCNEYNEGKKEVEQNLIAVTVFKYSLIFWNDAFNNSSNPWFNFVKAAYVDKTLSYDNKTKGLFGDIWNGIKNGISSISHWVGNNWPNIVSGLVVGGLSDYSGARITAFWLPGNIYAIAAGAAVSSVVGGLGGWIAPGLLGFK